MNDLNELIEVYDNASPGPLVLSAGNTGRVELADDEEADFAEYESREDAACAVTLHNAFPTLVSNVRRLVVVARQALEESPNGPIAIETSELLRVALEPFKSLKTGRKR